MATHLSRITALESSLEKLTRDAATAREVGSLRDESRKLIESHHLDLLNLKAHVWGIGESADTVSGKASLTPMVQTRALCRARASGLRNRLADVVHNVPAEQDLRNLSRRDTSVRI